jgi:hypothetical protein
MQELLPTRRGSLVLTWDDLRLGDAMSLGAVVAHSPFVLMILAVILVRASWFSFCIGLGDW